MAKAVFFCRVEQGFGFTSGREKFIMRVQTSKNEREEDVRK